jgi:HK97 gp10 family phage protein
MPSVIGDIKSRGGITVTVSNRIPQKKAALARGMLSMIQKLAADGQATAQSHAPVRTGLLRASISHEVIQTGDLVVGRVYTNTEYAIYQEYGTRYHAPHPFMAPAAMTMERGAKAAMHGLRTMVQNA